MGGVSGTAYGRFMSYRDVASKQVLIWGCTAVGARMPVAMAPLALVFLVRERPGGYSLGAVLAAAYVMGEIVGAPVLGMRLRQERARVHLAVGLACGTVGFAGLGGPTGRASGRPRRVRVRGRGRSGRRHRWVAHAAHHAGVGLTLSLTALGWWGEARHAARSAQGADTAVAARQRRASTLP